MKQCPSCGRSYPVEYMFCEDDASTLLALPESASQSADATHLLVTSPQAPPPASTEQGHSRVPTAAIGAALFLVIASITAIVLIVRKRSGEGAPVVAATPQHTLQQDGVAPRPTIVPSLPAQGPALPPPTPLSAQTTPSMKVCSVDGAAVSVANDVSIGDGLWLGAAGSRLALGYVAPPRHRNGGDDVALAEISWRGGIERVIDPPQRSGARGNLASPLTIQKVRPSFFDGEIAPLVDAVEQPVPGERYIRCGAFRQQVSSGDPMADPRDNAPAFISDGSTYFCRSFSDGAQREGIVFGMRTVGAGVEVFVWRSSGEGRALWSLPRSSGVDGSLPTLRGLRGQDVMEGAALERVPGHGYVVVFRFHDTIRVGALSTDFSTVGPLHIVPVDGVPGRPQIASNGRELALVVGVRPRGSHRDPSIRYRIHGARFEFGRAPAALSPLPTGETIVGDEFAPALRGFGDGSWLLAWTFGEMSENLSRGWQSVRVIRLNQDLSVGSNRVDLPYSGPASDPEVAVDGDRFAVVALVGAQRLRVASFLSGRCR